VNINANLTMNITIGTMAWGDSTGIDTGFSVYGWQTNATGAGYVGVTNFNITNLTVKARESDTYGTGYLANGRYTGTGTYGYSTLALKPITIDVARDNSYVTYNGATFVRIGLGSLQISMDSMSMNVALGTTPAALNQVLGTCNLGDMVLYINPTSYVDIYNSKPGVTSAIFITLNIVADQFIMDYLSWGDTDGAADNTNVVDWYTGATAGYVGLDNLVVGGPITIKGTMVIDVGTAATGIYATQAHGRVTLVHIGFPQLFQLNIAGPITADVKLDSVAALDSANAGTLGNIYLAGFGLSITPGSWVDIWAH
jgi:hypothetical protein